MYTPITALASRGLLPALALAAVVSAQSSAVQASSSTSDSQSSSDFSSSTSSATLSSSSSLDPASSFSSATSTATPGPVSLPGDVCPTYDGMTFIDDSGYAYDIYCSSDMNPGASGDPKTFQTQGAALAWCDVTQDCVALSMLSNSDGTFTVYPHSSFSSTVGNRNNVMVAVLHSYYTTLQPAGTYTTSQAPSSGAFGIADLCPYYDGASYTDAEGSTYQIFCGEDSNPGADLGLAAAANLTQCLGICDGTPKCVAATLAGGNCYMKSDFVAPSSNYRVATALLYNANNYTRSLSSISAGSSGCGSQLPSWITANSVSVSRTGLSQGQERNWRIRVPTAYDINTPAPLVFALHGVYESPSNIEFYSAFSSDYHNPFAIVVYPDSLLGSWQSDPNAQNEIPAPYDDQSWIYELVANMTSQFCVDEGRVWATGFSEGAALVSAMACNESSPFTAYAPHSPTIHTTTTADNCTGDAPSTILTNSLIDPICEPGSEVAMLEIHGLEDTTALYAGGPNQGYCVPSIPHWITDWAMRDGLSATNGTQMLDGGSVTLYQWGQGQVSQYSISGLGHQWASKVSGAPMDATAAMMNFFYNGKTANANVLVANPQVSSSSQSTMQSSTSSALDSSSSSTTTESDSSTTSVLTTFSSTSLNVELPTDIVTSDPFVFTTAIPTSDPVEPTTTTQPEPVVPPVVVPTTPPIVKPTAVVSVPQESAPLTKTTTLPAKVTDITLPVTQPTAISNPPDAPVPTTTESVEVPLPTTVNPLPLPVTDASSDVIAAPTAISTPTIPTTTVRPSVPSVTTHKTSTTTKRASSTKKVSTKKTSTKKTTTRKPVKPVKPTKKPAKPTKKTTKKHTTTKRPGRSQRSL